LPSCCLVSAIILALVAEVFFGWRASRVGASVRLRTIGRGLGRPIPASAIDERERETRRSFCNGGRWLSLGLVALAGFALQAAGGPTARAAQPTAQTTQPTLNVVMPFSCRRADGELQITPSEPRYYPVSAARTVETRKTCAGQTCRNLELADFDVGCDGGDARWADVAAIGIALLGGGVRFSDGKLLFQYRGRQRNHKTAACRQTAWPPVGAPLARMDRGFRDADCRSVGMFRADRPAFALPEGLAPLAAIGARLVTVPAYLRTDARPPLPGRNPRTDRIGGLAAAAVPLRVARAAAADQSVRLAQAATVPAVLRPTTPERKALPNAPVSTTATATAAGQALGPWLTLIEVQVPTDGGPGSEQRKFEKAVLAILLGVALIGGLISSVGWLLTARRKPFRAADAYEVILRRDGVDLDRPDAQLCGELCKSAQSLVIDIHDTIAKLHGVAPLRRTLLREIRDLEYYLASLVATTPQDDMQWQRMRAKLQRIVKDIVRLKDIVDSARRSLSTAPSKRGLPKDRGEAFEALGANPTTSERILKKLVDALRATWHPDLAVDEDDRLAREDRIKQINAAWDLISGKRAEA
jgi:DnaJ-domain-containing protein 1